VAHTSNDAQGIASTAKALLALPDAKQLLGSHILLDIQRHLDRSDWLFGEELWLRDLASQFDWALSR
jgi:hypothetical protein